MPANYASMPDCIVVGSTSSSSMRPANRCSGSVHLQPAKKANIDSLSNIDMNKTTENTKTATKNVVATKGVMSAVKAVVGEEPDTFADVDEHPGSLDLPTQKHEITKLLADFRAPAGAFITSIDALRTSPAGQSANDVRLSSLESGRLKLVFFRLSDQRHPCPSATRKPPKSPRGLPRCTSEFPPFGRCARLRRRSRSPE